MFNYILYSLFFLNFMSFLWSNSRREIIRFIEAGDQMEDFQITDVGERHKSL
jgi:hypothetical protein